MRHAWRSLCREKFFTILAVATLGLGIGAVATVFSVVNGVLLKALPYKDPDRLYSISVASPKFVSMGYSTVPVNAANFEDWQTRCESCDQSALFRPDSFNLTGNGEPEHLGGVSATWQLFQVLGIEPQIGRTFVRSDDQPGNNAYVVITDGLWRRRFNADRNIVGQSVHLNGTSHTVIGVLAANFRFPKGDQLSSVFPIPDHIDVFKPIGLDWSKQKRIGNFNYLALMRLKPGSARERAEAETTAVMQDAARDMGVELKTKLIPLQEQVTGSARKSLWLLLGAVSAVLLIVCVNLGNLMLVRANGRLRDAAIRRALGATRTQLLKPVMSESFLLALMGGTLGVCLAFAGVRILAGIGSINIPRLNDIQVDGITLLFGFIVSTACAVLFGGAPAVWLMRSQPVDALKSGAVSTTDNESKLQFRRWLVGLEVALSTVLLVVAGWLGLSLFKLMNVDRGFHFDHVVTAEVSLPDTRYPKDEQRIIFVQQMIDKLQALPGVRSAGLVSALPLRGVSWGTFITKEGETRPTFERPFAEFRFVSENYFDAMGISIIRGRVPNQSDRSHKVAVISSSGAEKLWPGEDALGKRIHDEGPKGEKKETVEIVGVVADVRTDGLEKPPPPMVYVPYWDGAYWQGNVWKTMSYAVRTSQDPATMANILRSAVLSIDSELPLTAVRTMDEIVSDSVSLRAFRTALAVAFALSAVVLACLGIYGVLSYSVSRRTNEMGIRLALGASPVELTRSVLAQAMKPVVAGAVVGVLGALWIGQLLTGLLFGVNAHDPAVISLSAALILGVAVIASWIPARRAARVDPKVALRYE